MLQAPVRRRTLDCMNKKMAATSLALLLGSLSAAAPAQAYSSVVPEVKVATKLRCNGAADVPYTNANVKVRSQPSTSAKQVGRTLPRDTYVSNGQNRNGWTKISFPVVGYIRSDLLSCCACT